METLSRVPCKQRLPTWTRARYLFVNKGHVALTYVVSQNVRPAQNENYNNCDVIRQDVIRYSHGDWLKRFSVGLTFRDLRLAISKIQQENFQNIARL